METSFLMSLICTAVQIETKCLGGEDLHKLMTFTVLLSLGSISYGHMWGHVKRVLLSDRFCEHSFQFFISILLQFLSLVLFLNTAHVLDFAGCVFDI